MTLKRGFEVTGGRLNVQALRDDMGLQRDYNIAIQNSFSALEDLPEDVESAINQQRNHRRC